MAPAGTVEIPREVADRDGLDLSTIRPDTRPCRYCQGSGSGPYYGFSEHDRAECESCGGSGREPLRCECCSVVIATGTHCAACDAMTLSDVTAALIAADARLAVFVVAGQNARLTEELRRAMRIAGAMLAAGVVAGPRVVTTTGEAVGEGRAA